MTVLLEDRTRLSASEQLYYYGAPVAHVVAYQERLRAKLIRQRIARIQRWR